MSAMKEHPSGESTSQESKRLIRFGLAGAIAAGILASACCIGPLLLVFVGISGAGALVALEPYRPYFMALTLVFLAGAFYATYRSPKTTDSPDGTCCTYRNKRVRKIMLWVATMVALGLLFFPQILLALLD